MIVGDNPQAGMFDRTVEDADLEEAIERHLDFREGGAQAAKAARQYRKRLAPHNLQPGERLRVGRYVVEGQARHGGGFTVEAWTSVSGRIVETDA